MSETMLIQPSLSGRLTEEYKLQRSWISAQPALIQRYLEVQGKQIAEAVVERRSRVSFSLPDRIVCPLENGDRPAPVTIPANHRAYSAGNLMSRLRKVELHKQVRRALTELEQSPDPAIAFATSLLRCAAVMHLVHEMLPAGRTVTYNLTYEGELIPFVLEDRPIEPEPVITTADGTYAEGAKSVQECSDNPVPFVPYARRFFLPQWVAFDENGDLLVKSVEEAKAHIKSMQRFMEVIFLAVALAPFISADDEYIKKRNGMLGQLIDQGRALAIYQTKEIITLIKERAAAGSLNRGLSLNLPYFNDQELRIDIMKIDVIPAGRIMFVPAFVVLAMRREQTKVSQDMRLNASTRNHLLDLLKRIGQPFEIT